MRIDPGWAPLRQQRAFFISCAAQQINKNVMLIEALIAPIYAIIY